MRQNDLYEQKRRWQRIFLFFFLLFLTGVLIPGGCASEGKKSQSGKKGDPRDPSAQVLQTEASGEVTYGNDLVVLDSLSQQDFMKQPKKDIAYRMRSLRQQDLKEALQR